MKKQRDDKDLIEEFLDGSLNEDKRIELQARIKSDPAFADQYDQRLRLQNAWLSTTKYSNTYAKIISAMKEEKSVIKFHRDILLAAASVIALFGIGSFLLFVLPEKSPKQMQEAKIATDSIQIENINEPQQIGIPKFGKSDTLSRPEVRVVELLSPGDHFKFNNGDTIRFEWKSSLLESYLTIKKKGNDSLILRVEVRDKQNIYIFKTFGLEAGTYIWYIDDPKNSREFQLQ